MTSSYFKIVSYFNFLEVTKKIRPVVQFLTPLISLNEGTLLLKHSQILGQPVKWTISIEKVLILNLRKLIFFLILSFFSSKFWNSEMWFEIWIVEIWIFKFIILKFEIQNFEILNSEIVINEILCFEILNSEIPKLLKKKGRGERAGSDT